jgi:flagellar motor switch protein FliM
MATLLSQNEVDVLMRAISSGQVAPTTDTATEKKNTPQKNVKLYDFRHPVMFLKDQLRTLQMIHESFARAFSNTMTAYLRTNVKMKCIGVDQISYGEFILSLPDPCTIVNTRIQPSEGRALIAIHPIIGMGVVDRVTGGNGSAEASTRPFTEIEQVIIEEMVATTIKDLEPAWNRILPIKFHADSVENSAQFIQVASQEDTVVAITMELTFSEIQGIMSLCYPFRALTPVIEKLNAKQWVAEEQASTAAKNKIKIQNGVRIIPLRLSAQLGTSNITFSDLMQIKPGDVLMLDKNITQMADIQVGGRVRYRGHLGASHGKTAILIHERAEPEK